MKPNQRFSTWQAILFLVLSLFAPALHAQLGQMEKVEIPFRGEKAYVALPNQRDMTYKEAVVEMQSGGAGFAKAEKLLVELAQNKDKVAENWLALGICREALGKFEAAEEALKKAKVRGNKRVKEEADAGLARVAARKRFAGQAP